MPISEKDLTQILSWLEQSHWQELHLESGSFKLSYAKTGVPMAGGVPPPARAATVPARPARPTAETRPAPVQATPVPVSVPEGMSAVRAPTLGTFYVAPKPGAPPFVAVGQQVGEEEPVAIVEVMKLMNIVKAGVNGVVRRVCAANGDLVEFDQVLFLIEPAA
jgi:acetyl-CoA carboxylase biotin carboxyl carrier protein